MMVWNSMNHSESQLVWLCSLMKKVPAAHISLHDTDTSRLVSTELTGRVPLLIYLIQRLPCLKLTASTWNGRLEGSCYQKCICKPSFKEMWVTCYTNIDYRFFQDISSCSQQEPWLIKVKIGYCNRNPYSIPTKMNVNECLRCLIRNIPHPSLWQTVTEKLFDLSICRKPLVFQMYPTVSQMKSTSMASALLLSWALHQMDDLRLWSVVIGESFSVIWEVPNI